MNDHICVVDDDDDDDLKCALRKNVPTEGKCKKRKKEY